MYKELNEKIYTTLCVLIIFSIVFFTISKLFNEKEDTNIKGKEFQYLNFLFTFDTSKYLFRMEKIYFMYAILEEGLAIRDEYENKRHYEEEPFVLVFNRYMEN